MALVDLDDPGWTKRPSPSALLLLADGRFPGGGHAHSGGIEAAAALENVRDVASLEAFLRGRAASAGAVAAAFAAAACAAMASSSAASRVGTLAVLDTELEARLPSPALRFTSRRLGRQLLRTGRRVWPHPHLDELAADLPGGPHHAIGLGAIAAAAGMTEADVALAAVHDCVAGPATAAVRLLGLDPFAVHAMLAGLGPLVMSVAAQGASHAHSAPADLPSWSAPLLDILAERHASWGVRLFAS